MLFRSLFLTSLPHLSSFPPFALPHLSSSPLFLTSLCSSSPLLLPSLCSSSPIFLPTFPNFFLSIYLSVCITSFIFFSPSLPQYLFLFTHIILSYLVRSPLILSCFLSSFCFLRAKFKNILLKNRQS